MDIPIEMLRPNRSVIISGLDNAENPPGKKSRNKETTLTVVENGVTRKIVLKRRPNVIRYPGREPKKELETATEAVVEETPEPIIEPVINEAIESVEEEALANPETTVVEELPEATEPALPDYTATKVDIESITSDSITVDGSLLQSLLDSNIDSTLINDVNSTLEINIEESMFDIPILFGKEEIMKLNSKDVTPLYNYIERCKLHDVMRNDEGDTLAADVIDKIRTGSHDCKETGYMVYFINNTREPYYWKDPLGIVRLVKPLIATYTPKGEVEHEGLYVVMKSYGLDRNQKEEAKESCNIVYNEKYWRRAPSTPLFTNFLDNTYARVLRLKTDGIKSRPFGMYVPGAGVTVYDTKEKAMAKVGINDIDEIIELRDIYAEVLNNHKNGGVTFTYRLVHNEDIPISRWVSHNGAIRLVESVKPHTGLNGQPAPDGLYITSVTMNGLSPEVTVIPASEKEAYERYVFKSKADAYHAGDFETRMREIKNAYEMALDKEKEKLRSQTREMKKLTEDLQNRIDDNAKIRDNISAGIKERESVVELKEKIQEMTAERLAAVNEERIKSEQRIKVLEAEHAAAIRSMEKQYKEELRLSEKQKDADIKELQKQKDTDIRELQKQKDADIKELQKQHKENINNIEERHQKELDRARITHDTDMARTIEAFMVDVRKANEEAERARNALAAERKHKHTEAGYIYKERQWGFETFGKAVTIICGIGGGLFALFKMAPVAMAGIVTSAIKMKAFI